MSQKIAVIGAGITGLTCANELRRSGFDVTIFEKSRGIGGRMATRRTPENLRFDHGAQFFTVQSREFRQFLAGGAKKWQAAGEFDQTQDWYIGTPDIKSFLRPIAKQLDIRLSTQIQKIERLESGWALQTDTESFDDFDKVCIAAPAAQTAALSAFSLKMQTAIAPVEMDPCWTLMMAFKDPVALDFDVKKYVSGNIDWAARNSSKWGRKETPDCWVAHASPAWSRENLELSRDDVLEILLPEMLSLLGKDASDLLYFSAHRWRYANVTNPVGKPFIQDETGTLFGAGDWCAGTCVEHAFNSGLTLAKHITSLQ